MAISANVTEQLIDMKMVTKTKGQPVYRIDIINGNQTNKQVNCIEMDIEMC